MLVLRAPISRGPLVLCSSISAILKRFSLPPDRLLSLPLSETGILRHHAVETTGRLLYVRLDL
jgi:hypothetical protein